LAAQVTLERIDPEDLPTSAVLSRLPVPDPTRYLIEVEAIAVIGG
jgi:hypothetical protein